MNLTPFLVSLAVLFGETANADLVKHCSKVDPNTCFSIGKSVQTASGGGTGEIFFQLQAAANKQWIALGQGNGMHDSRIFVVYADEAGTNVTLSPRVSKGHFEPVFDEHAQVSLLDGSGVADGKITANVRCSNCNAWPGGSMDFSSSDTHWIYAFLSGSPLKSDSQTAHINIHNYFSRFPVDFTVASVAATANPFLNGSEPIQDGGPTNKDDAASDSPGLGWAVPLHGIIMSVVFVIAFPVGAILIRLGSFKGLVTAHAGLQALALVGSIMGSAVGYYVATRGQNQLSKTHPATGLLIIFLLLAQPLLGYLHHKRYIQYSRPTLFAIAHVWYGRVLLSIGLINGYLGLRLVGQPWLVQAIYTLAAIVSWLVWMGSIFLGKRNEARVKKQQNTFRLATLTEEEDVDEEFRD